jgi:uncharacterized protein (DUF362 family)
MKSSTPSIRFTRRDFLRLGLTVGGLAALSPLLEACSLVGPDSSTPLVSPDTEAPATTAASSEPTATLPPEPTGAASVTTVAVEASPTVTSAVDQTFSQVALVKTSNRSEGTLRAIELLGVNPVSGKQVFLKPNFNSADPAPGSTHPEVLRALVRQLQQMGAAAITVGDRSGMGDTHAVMKHIGVFKLAKELGFDTVVFDELSLKDWVEFQPPGSHWRQGFLVARPCLVAEALVQTCCLKTHGYGGVFTMSLKNSVGMAAKRHPTNGYEYMSELHSSSYQTSMIAEINAAYTPALILMDSVEAFVTGGPAQGKKVTPGVMLAATDRVAIDSVGVAILKMFGASLPGPAFSQKQIARAVELGLGVDSPEKIEFLTGDAESAAFAEQMRQVLAAEG